MKKFRDLLIHSIDREIPGTTIDRLLIIRTYFKVEMLHGDLRASPELLTQWLQRGFWGIRIPKENAEIIRWYELTLGRNAKERIKESERWIARYWEQCGKTLYELLYE